MLRVKGWSGCCTSQAEGSLVDTFSVTSLTSKSSRSSAVWAASGSTLARGPQKCAQMQEFKAAAPGYEVFLFSHTEMVSLDPEYMSLLREKNQAGDGRLVWLTACGDLQCDRFVCLEAVLFPFVTWELSPLILSKSHSKWAAVQAVLKVNRPVTFPWFLHFFFFFFSFWSQAGGCCCIK